VANYLSYRRHGYRILVALFVLTAGARAETIETSSPAVPDRQHVNESCSQQADALGLHDQARWNFRAHCKVQSTAESCSQAADTLGLHGDARWNFRARCKA
jgi:hypothetical protein